MSTNIREIAKNAGVIVATVSRYINENGYVSKKTGKRIQEEIDKTGYTSNMHAQAIFKKKSQTIGLMIPNIFNPFFNEVITFVEDRVVKAGYSLLLCNTGDDVEKERIHIDMLKRFRVDGIIAARSLCREDYINSSIPVVSFENYISDDVPIVTANNYEGGRLAFQHLHSLGCKKILHIKGPETFEATIQRAKGFLEEAALWGVNVDIIKAETDFQNDMLLSNDEDFIKEILKYDGIFVFNDVSCANIMKMLLSEGVKIPEDIKVMGFDNSYISTLVKPSITTITQHVKDIADKIVDILLDQIDNKGVYPLLNLIDVELIVRASTVDDGRQ